MHPTIRLLATITVALSVVLFVLHISGYMAYALSLKRSLSDYTNSPCMDQCASAFATCNKNCNDQSSTSPCLTACNNAADSCKAICYQNIFSQVDTIGVVLWTSDPQKICKTLTIYGELNPNISLDSLTGEITLINSPPPQILTNPYFNIYAAVGEKEYNNNFWSLSFDNTVAIGGTMYDIKILLTKGDQSQMVNMSITIPKCTASEFAHGWGYQIKKNYKSYA